MKRVKLVMLTLLMLANCTQIGLTKETDDDENDKLVLLALAVASSGKSNTTSGGDCGNGIIYSATLTSGSSVTAGPSKSVSGSSPLVIVPINGVSGKTVTLSGGTVGSSPVYLWDGNSSPCNITGSSPLATNTNISTTTSTFNFTSNGYVILLVSTPTAGTNVTAVMN